MLSQTRKLWHSALQDRGFRNKFIIVGVLLGLYAFLTPYLFQFIQQRKGHVLNDYLLNRLPAYDLSIWIFDTLYILIIAALYFLVQEPHRLLLLLKAYLILSVFRSITMLLFPLEPPVNIIELNDPLVQYLFYQQSITKDLFFSGHTSVLVLLTMGVTSFRLRLLFIIGTLSVALMLLFQHAHYTVDILFAPLFSWVAMQVAKKIP